MLIKPKKSLGQNFLNDKNIINKIIEASKIGLNDQVLEVGPGTGSLTKFIVSRYPKKLYVIEKDKNLATKILSNWCLNNKLSVTKMILMFQKEVAERILADVNSKEYGRITILSNWKFDINKIIDVKPNSFYPRPKIHSTVLEFIPKKKIFEIKDPKNLEKITNVFFNQRRKMIKKPINILFKNSQFNYKKFGINPSDRPENINVKKYLEIVNEYESSGS